MVPDVPVLRGERPGHGSEELPAAHVERAAVEPRGQVQPAGAPMSREGFRTSKSAVCFFSVFFEIHEKLGTLNVALYVHLHLCKWVTL